MSPEGLNQRFNRYAVLFLQRVFSPLVKSQLNDTSQIPNQYTSYFQRIRILDATSFITLMGMCATTSLSS